LRLALFGGAFDPIHNAHLRIAKEAARVCTLDRILFVPAAHPPHKAIHASYEDRYRMVEMAVGDDPRLLASRLEADSARTFSIDTIEKLKTELPGGDQLFFLIGADAFAEIRTWKRWRDVIAAVDFIVVSRPGHRYETPGEARVHRLDTLQLTVSSSDIRARLSAGDDRVDAPAAVLDYIRDKHLYG
jgi:nicotinate-nucleotide adenylyltransferase